MCDNPGPCAKIQLHPFELFFFRAPCATTPTCISDSPDLRVLSHYCGSRYEGDRGNREEGLESTVSALAEKIRALMGLI